jgi:exonuclease III
MRGRWHNGADKWLHINQLVKEKKIGVLALQETHLTKEDEDVLNTTPSLRIHIISSINPVHTNAKGVAIVINKMLLGTSGIKTHEIVPGRAILIIIPWLKDTPIRILMIYAQNNAATNQQFWELIQMKLRNLPKLDVMLGDFNVVEDSLDRLPAKSDHANASHSLHQLKSHLQLRDGWCHENPSTLSYTFSQSVYQGGSQSHIDRIYISTELLPFSKEWDITPPGIYTDHQLVSVRILSKCMPFVGKGHWSLPLFVLKDKDLSEQIITMGKSLQTEIENCSNQRTEDLNPQLAFSRFKTKAIHLCRTAAKKSIPKKMNQLKSQLRTTMEDESLTEEDKRIIGSHIREKLNQIEIL